MDQIQAGKFDLIIADIALGPKQPHGISLVQMARSKIGHVPALLMTGFHELGAHAEDIGPVLLKPISPADLVKHAWAVLQGRERP
jgi:CheY-like chemotaxis protein